METMITENMVDELRNAVRPYLEDKRYSHTLAVEEEAAFLGSLYLPQKTNELRCAALLHDITKKLSPEEHISLCQELGITVTPDMENSPKLFHAITGAALAKKDFPRYADSEVISGIRWHTTGYAGMDMFESIIYLADYIEKTRTFDECVALRKFFCDGLREADGDDRKYRLFLETMVMSFDMTVRILTEEKSLIDRNTVEARNSFLMKLRGLEKK